MTAHPCIGKSCDNSNLTISCLHQTKEYKADIEIQEAKTTSEQQHKKNNGLQGRNWNAKTKTAYELQNKNNEDYRSELKPHKGKNSISTTM